MNNEVTVCIPSIPPRRDKLKRAVQSVMMQDTPVGLSVYIDRGKRGAAYARDMALAGAGTEWVAFLDDDDEFDSDHVTSLLECAIAHQADYVWSRYRIAHPNPRHGGVVPNRAPRYVFPYADGNTHPLGAGTFEQWNDEQPAQTTVTTLVRRDLALDVGGFRGIGARDGLFATKGTMPGEQVDGQRAGEDWSFTLRCRAAGATFRHHPAVTWTWHHHESNTSGLPDRW